MNNAGSYQYDLILIDSFSLNSGGSTYNLGLLTLATLLQLKQIKVKIINIDLLISQGKIKLYQTLNQSLESIADLLAAYFSSPLLGFYAISNSFPYSILLAEKIKKQDRAIKIIMGGPHATFNAREILENYAFIDLIGLGEGEAYIIPLIKKLLAGQSLASINGIAYRQAKKIVLQWKRPIHVNPDQIPVIDYQLAGIQKKVPKIEVEVGRGCPFQCTFCSTSLFFQAGQCRIKSIPRLLHEIKTLQQNFCPRYFSFTHDLFTINKEYVKQFCESLIKNNMTIQWSCSSRIDTLDPAVLNLMKRAGCTHIYIGLETGSPRLQKKINKNIDLNRALDLLIRIKQLKITPIVSFIYGFYEETVADLKLTLDLISRLLQQGIYSLQLHRFVPLPETKEYEKIKNQLWITSDTINYSNSNNSSKWIRELYPLLKSHSRLYASFYDFTSPVRQDYERLDLFILFMQSLFQNYQYTASKVFEFYEYDLLRFFNQHKQKLWKKNSQLEPAADRGTGFCSHCLDLIISDTLNQIPHNKILLTMYAFEKKLVDFGRSPRQSTVLSFPINVIKLKQTPGQSQSEIEEAIAVKLSKTSLNQIKVERIQPGPG